MAKYFASRDNIEEFISIEDGRGIARPQHSCRGVEESMTSERWTPLGEEKDCAVLSDEELIIPDVPSIGRHLERRLS